MFAKLWNSFPEELKATKQKIIYKCNGRPFHEEKKI